MSSLANGLGALSAVLGLPAAAAPRAVARMIGLVPTGRTTRLVRVVGGRELAAAGGLLSGAAPALWIGSRVAGDAMDLTLLGRALWSRRKRPVALLATTGIVGAITVLDALSLARALRAGRGGSLTSQRGRTSVTINRPRDEVERLWLQRRPLTVPDTQVSFRTAPANQGAEVVVEMAATERVGTVGTTVAKVTGRDPMQRVRDELRRFKQMVETGEIARSDALPGGIDTAHLLTQRVAQPPEAPVPPAEAHWSETTETTETTEVGR